MLHAWESSSVTCSQHDDELAALDRSIAVIGQHFQVLPEHCDGELSLETLRGSGGIASVGGASAAAGAADVAGGPGGARGLAVERVPGMVRVRVWDGPFIVKQKVESLYTRGLLGSEDISPLHLALLHKLADVAAGGSCSGAVSALLAMQPLKDFEHMLRWGRPVASKSEILIRLIRDELLTRHRVRH